MNLINGRNVKQVKDKGDMFRTGTDNKLCPHKRVISGYCSNDNRLPENVHILEAIIENNVESK